MVSLQETDRQRAALKKAYPGPEWAKKVNGMLADQVTAIYFKLKAQNKV